MRNASRALVLSPGTNRRYVLGHPRGPAQRRKGWVRSPRWTPLFGSGGRLVTSLPEVTIRKRADRTERAQRSHNAAFLKAGDGVEAVSPRPAPRVGGEVRTSGPHRDPRGSLLASRCGLQREGYGDGERPRPLARGRFSFAVHPARFARATSLSFMGFSRRVEASCGDGYGHHRARAGGGQCRPGTADHPAGDPSPSGCAFKP